MRVQDRNGITLCHPGVRGWGLAGSGNSFAFAVTAAVAPATVAVAWKIQDDIPVRELHF